jgi:hypothetical protein
MKYFHSKIIYSCLMLVLLVSNLFSQQSKGETSKLDEILNAKEDTYPCRDIKLSNNVREVERNIIAFLNYEQGNLVSIEIKPTCYYKEPRMPKDIDYPVLSERTFRRVVSRLEKLKPIRNLVEGAKLSAVTYTLRLYTDKYRNADIEIWGYNCAKRRRGFGCGIRKFIVYYSRNAI